MLNKTLKGLRLKRKISQHHLASELEISQTAYYKWEKGLVKPSFQNLIKIALFYNISVYELILISDWNINPQNQEINKKEKLDIFLKRQTEIISLLNKQANLIQKVLLP